LFKKRRGYFNEINIAIIKKVKIITKSITEFSIIKAISTIRGS